jgi:hypothetical protein
VWEGVTGGGAGVSRVKYLTDYSILIPPPPLHPDWEGLPTAARLDEILIMCGQFPHHVNIITYRASGWERGGFKPIENRTKELGLKVVKIRKGLSYGLEMSMDLNINKLIKIIIADRPKYSLSKKVIT